MRRVLPALAGILLTLWVTVAVAESQGGKRVALIVGNAAYSSFGSLNNPRNDAEDIAAVLRQIGFTVIEGRDLSKRDMDRRLAEFSRTASDADTAIVYYAGHGLQYQNQNFLVPTDAQLKDGFDIPFETTSVDSVIGALESARGARILILDACRNLPLAEGVKRGSGTGLARVAGRQNLIIAYATQPNQEALDGAGRNSPYAEALAKSLAESGLEVGQVLQRVAVSVKAATRGKQVPEFSRSYADEIFLNRAETDIQAWSRLRSSDVIADLKGFIEKFPASFLADGARIRIELLESRTRYAEQEIQNRRQEERRSKERELWARREEEENHREKARLNAEKARREEESSAEQARLVAQREAEEARKEVLRREDVVRQEQAHAAAQKAARLAAAEILRREEMVREDEARQEAERAVRLAAEQKRRDELNRQEQARLDAEKAARLAAAEQKRRDDAARQEQARLDAEKAARLAAAEQKRRDEANRQEQARLDAEKAARLAAAEQKRRDEADRQEQARLDVEKAARLAAAEQKRRDEADRQEQARLDIEKAARLAAVEQKRRDEADRQEQARLDAEKAARLAAVEQKRRDEADRQEQARLEVEKAARLAAAEQLDRDEASRREQAAIATARTAAEALVRDKAAESSSGGFAHVASGAAPAESSLPYTTYASLDQKSGADPKGSEAKATGSPVQADLQRSVQRRLAELGCYSEPVESNWGRQSAAALQTFYVSAGNLDGAGTGLNRSVRIGSASPDQGTLDHLNGYNGRICPLVCPVGAEIRGEVCVTITCPSGAILRNGACEVTRPAAVEDETPARGRKAARPPVTREAPKTVGAPEPRPAPKAARAPEPRPAPKAARAPEPRPAPKAARAPEPRPVPKAARAPEPRPAPKVAVRPAPTKPTVRIVQPMRASPRVPSFSRAAPVESARASSSDYSPAQIGAVRAMSRMP